MRLDPTSEGVVNDPLSVVGKHALQTNSDHLGATGEPARTDEAIDGFEKFVGELHGNLNGHAPSIPNRITEECRNRSSIG